MDRKKRIQMRQKAQVKWNKAVNVVEKEVLEIEKNDEKEETDSEAEDEPEDDEVFENIEEMEMDLCQLINENFRFDDDELFLGLGLETT